MSEKEAEELNATYAVSNLRGSEREGQVELRVVSQKSPHQDAKAMEPVLEDAYLYYYLCERNHHRGAWE